MYIFASQLHLTDMAVIVVVVDQISVTTVCHKRMFASMIIKSKFDHKVMKLQNMSGPSPLDAVHAHSALIRPTFTAPCLSPYNTQDRQYSQYIPPTPVSLNGHGLILGIFVQFQEVPFARDLFICLQYRKADSRKL